MYSFTTLYYTFHIILLHTFYRKCGKASFNQNLRRNARLFTLITWISSALSFLKRGQRSARLLYPILFLSIIKRQERSSGCEVIARLICRPNETAGRILEIPLARSRRSLITTSSSAEWWHSGSILEAKRRLITSRFAQSRNIRNGEKRISSTFLEERSTRCIPTRDSQLTFRSY